MDLTLEEAVGRLANERRYRYDVQLAFGRDPNAADLDRALTAYVHTVLSGDSPFDRYLFGDQAAFSEQELAGLKIFRGKANCTFCHSGPTFSDEEFHNTGVAWHDRGWLDDGQFSVAHDERDSSEFKTTTLCEVGHTVPYMHDGSFASLEDVVDFYSDGTRANPNLDPELRRLNLSNTEKAQLVALLTALNGSVQAGKSRHLRNVVICRLNDRPFRFTQMGGPLDSTERRTRYASQVLLHDVVKVFCEKEWPRFEHDLRTKSKAVAA